MDRPVPLAVWLDANLPGWRALSAADLNRQLQAMWKAGRFRKLRSHTRNSPAEAVRVGDSHFAYIEF